MPITLSTTLISPILTLLINKKQTKILRREVSFDVLLTNFNSHISHLLSTKLTIKYKLLVLNVEVEDINHRFESMSKSHSPAPIIGGCPNIILLLGVLHLSV